jgi:hypothetical protein
MLCVHLHVLQTHEVVLTKKVIFYVAYVKMTKIVLYENKPFRDTFLCLFCADHTKCLFFTKLCMSTLNMEISMKKII